MSALGTYDNTFGPASVFPMLGSRITFTIASVATGFAALALVGHSSTSLVPPPMTQTGPVASSGGPISAIGLATRSRGADPIADSMRHGLVPDARMPKGWVPDAMGSPDICRLPRGDVRWSIASIRDPLMRRAAGSRHAHAARHHQRSRALNGIATLDGTLRFQLSSGFQVSNGYTLPANAISAFEALPPLDIGELGVSGAVSGDTVHGLGNPTTSIEHRRAAPIGTAAAALQFDDRPGQLSAAAQAGLWNGAPATAMGVGYTLPNRIRLDATGVTNVNTWTNVGRTFQVSTVASIPLE